MALIRFVKCGLAVFAFSLIFGCANVADDGGVAAKRDFVLLDGVGESVGGGGADVHFAPNGCTRELLTAAVDSYLEALDKGDYTLMPLTSNARYVENDRQARQGRDRVVPFGEGLWSAPVTVDHHMNLIDVDQCATFTEVIAAANDPQYIFGVRLSVNATGETSILRNPGMMMKGAASSGFEISEVNVVLTQEGDWLFDANNYLRYSKAEDWSVLPVGQRISRAELLAGAEAYFKYFSDKTVEVPWGIPCARLEGGAYTGDRPNSTCNIGVPDLSMNIPTIWHLADVDHGMIVLYVFFGGPDTHLFRILPTGYRYIHTLTAMLQSSFQP
ncbi:MAG: hypothetical protein FWC23_08800 [Chitinispirillia bacterium]|nr:hypothetical protein [Chitinispirillia bacterium]MCL2269267.1 hypothetical protein [Chitinispirillia bacterium]